MADNAIIIIGVLVIAVLAIVVIFTLATTNSNTTTSGTTTQLVLPTSVAATTTAAPVTTIVPATPASANISKLFITRAQASSLLGGNGTYGVYQRTSAAQLQSAIPTTFAAYNVVAEYNMTYNATKVTTGNIMAEVIFPTSSAGALYSYILSQYPYFNASLITAQGANVINVSANSRIPGLTYSSSIFKISSTQINRTTNGTSTAGVLFQVLLGHTNSSVVIVSILELNGSKGVNATKLAQLTAQNLG